MKDKNGFTLPEVLTVITIMSVIIILTTNKEVRMLDQTKKKISDANKGHVYRGGGNPKRPVLCVETGRIFESCGDAARWCESNSSHILPRHC